MGDPSAAFFTAEGYPEAKGILEESLEGSYLGIGARVVTEDDKFLLLPFRNDPADKAGILEGDVLLSVDGQPMAGMGLQQIVERVSGAPGTEAGTKVSLRVERDGEAEPLEIDIFRNDVEFVSVQYQLLPGGIGYMRVSEFLENTAEQVFEGLEAFKGIRVLALILDLRSNPGGSLEAAHKVTGQFLPPGDLFIAREMQGGLLENLVINEEWDRVELDDLNIVVLVDDETVGEAEAVAAAMQDADRAEIIETKTFGKGSSNTFVELSDGSAIYLPTSRWRTPSGRLLTGDGVEPDMLITDPEAQVEEAYNYLDQLLPPFR